LHQPHNTEWPSDRYYLRDQLDEAA
jgi:hypothetical protein